MEKKVSLNLGFHKTQRKTQKLILSTWHKQPPKIEIKRIFLLFATASLFLHVYFVSVCIIPPAEILKCKSA